ETPRGFLLVLVEGGDALARVFQRLPLAGAKAGRAAFQGGARHLQRGGVGRRPAVEPTRVLDPGGVAPRAHVVDDVGDRLLDLAPAGALQIEQPLQGGVEPGVGGVENDDGAFHGYCAARLRPAPALALVPASAATSAPRSADLSF